MRLLLFCDLDDTLFSSHRKCPPQPDFQALAFLEDGSPISYASPRQQHWLHFWQRQALLIPVTARNLSAFRRVYIDFSAEAVLNHGALILEADGQWDAFWLQRCRDLAAGSASELRALAASLPREADLRTRLVEDAGLPLYLLLKSRHAADLSCLERARTWLETHSNGDFWLHHNGNNLAVLPRWLHKGAAVDYLLQRYRRHGLPFISIGMGDSPGDLDFMRLCDYVMAPQNSPWIPQHGR